MLRSAALGCLLLAAYTVAKEISATRIEEAPRQHGLDLSKAPLNTAVYRYETVTFTCWVSAASSGSHRVQWSEYDYYTPQLISDNDLILPGHPQAARYSIIHDDPLQYDLVIRNVSTSDARLYACSDVNAPETEPQRAAAQLIVINEPETCWSTIPSSGILFEGSSYSSNCNLMFTGNIVPVAYWEGPKPFLQVLHNAESSMMSSEMAFYGDRTFLTQDPLEWKLTFNFTNNFVSFPVESAVNIPTFEIIYRTPAVTVVWSPRYLNVVPVTDLYSVGDVVTVEADANPPATYSWYGEQTEDTIQGPTLTIPASWAGINQRCRVVAQNRINDIEYLKDIYIPCNVRAR